MSDSPQDFDLKFLPDWLKEAPSTNRYADFEGESDRPRRDRDDRRGPPRGDRPPDRRGPRPPGADRPRGPRPGGPGRPSGPGGGPPRSGDRRDERRGGGAGGRPFDRGRREENRPPREAPQPAPAEVRVDFLPEPAAGVGIARQIKASGRAYAVFVTAKLFLERPERHRVKVTSSKNDVPLFQVADGPVSFDRAAVERGAFLQLKDEYYSEETVQGEPIKGNWTNVARVRSTGALLGPTNHHGYQPALRKLYEERFSRRMSFPQFQHEEIEIVTDEQAVNDWKEQARNTTTYATKKEAEPVTFKTLFDTEQHFRKTYLAELVKSGTSLECSGPASRSGLDRHVSRAVRDAWEKERAFPQGLVNALRPYFNDAGLHFFKHRKRVLYVSATKPLRHPENQPFSDGITSILKRVEEHPRIKRPELAVKILGEGHDAPEAAPRKEQLAADLHYLLHIGHVIEFSDGALDLPLTPKLEAAEAKAAETKPEKGPKPEHKRSKPDQAQALPVVQTGEPAPHPPERPLPPAVPEAHEMTAAHLVPPPAASAPGTIEEPAPPVEEAPVPGEEEGEADPIVAANLAPIPADQASTDPAPAPAASMPPPEAPTPGHA